MVLRTSMRFCGFYENSCTRIEILELECPRKLDSPICYLRVERFLLIVKVTGIIPIQTLNPRMDVGDRAGRSHQVLHIGFSEGDVFRRGMFFRKGRTIFRGCFYFRRGLGDVVYGGGIVGRALTNRRKSSPGSYGKRKRASVEYRFFFCGNSRITPLRFFFPSVSSRFFLAFFLTFFSREFWSHRSLAFFLAFFSRFFSRVFFSRFFLAFFRAFFFTRFFLAFFRRVFFRRAFFSRFLHLICE